MENCTTALVTPMSAGEIDKEAFSRLCEFQLENGVRQFVVNGTTGESPVTSDKEKLILLQIAVDSGSAVVTAGCGTNDTLHSEHLIKQAGEAGIKRVLLVDCYYNAPSSLELREEYYGYLCAKFPETKFVAYVIPGRTGCELSVGDLIFLHNRYSNLDTVKEATGNIERMKKTRALSESICIMSGDDSLTFRMMTDTGIGAAGVVSVVSNVCPKAVQDMCVAAGKGGDNAKQLQEKLEPLGSMVGVKTATQKFRNPVPFKTLMAGLGMIQYSVRRPLGRLDKEAAKHVREIAARVWRDSPQLLEPVEKFFDVSIEKRLANDAYWTSY